MNFPNTNHKKQILITILILSCFLSSCSKTKETLIEAGYDKKVKLILGDGSKGVDKKKFDKIIVSATCPEVPKPLIKQLKAGGMIIAPVGEQYSHQELVCVQKTKQGKLVMKNLGGVVFVPLRGKYGWK